MLRNEILVVPSKKAEQEIAFQISEGAYVRLSGKKWSSKASRLLDLQEVTIFRPYHGSQKITLSHQELVKLLDGDSVGSSKKRQHGGTLKASAWNTLWNRLEGWSEEEPQEADETSRQIIESVYSNHQARAALEFYAHARQGGWGSHEALVLMIRGDYEEIFSYLPQEFDWDPEGSLVRW